jgi:hypothetical protein
VATYALVIPFSLIGCVHYERSETQLGEDRSRRYEISGQLLDATGQ